MRTTSRPKFEFPNKCRCGVWLYGAAAERGYCAACGPSPSGIVAGRRPTGKEDDGEDTAEPEG